MSKYSKDDYVGKMPPELDVEEEELEVEEPDWEDPGVLDDEQPELEDEGDPDNPRLPGEGGGD